MITELFDVDAWKKDWLGGSFLSYVARGEEPEFTLRGKIRRARKWGMSPSEIWAIFQTASQTAYRPNPQYLSRLQVLLNDELSKGVN